MRFLISLAAFALAACATPAAAPPALSGRIVLAGDSTVASFGADRAPQAGWGQMLDAFVASNVTLDNRAISGRSTKSFRSEGRWDELLAALQPGDVVLIQFGHNDSRDDAPERFAAPDTDYHDNLTRFVAEVRAKNAAPILVTPVTRRLWEGPAMVDTHGLYAAAMARAAREAHTPLIDLNTVSIAYFERFGVEGTKRDFFWLTAADGVARFPNGVEDNTHFSKLGACGVARLVAQALLEIGPPYAALIDSAKIDDDPDRPTRPPAVQACAAR